MCTYKEEIYQYITILMVIYTYIDATYQALIILTYNNNIDFYLLTF